MRTFYYTKAYQARHGAKKGVVRYYRPDKTTSREPGETMEVWPCDKREKLKEDKVTVLAAEVGQEVDNDNNEH